MTFKDFIAKIFGIKPEVIIQYQSVQITQPLILGQITISELAKILQPYAKEIYLSDNVFMLTSVNEAKKFTQKTMVSQANYSSEGHDCDNFSFALMGYWSEELSSFAFGIAWSGVHAFNWMVNDAKQLWVCEPQTNNWITISEAQKQDIYKDWRFSLC